MTGLLSAYFKAKLVIMNSFARPPVEMLLGFSNIITQPLPNGI